MLRNKKILLGVCGSIAAYKSALLIRQLSKEGAEVQVIMTTSASDFISKLTLSTLSKKPVYSEFVLNETGQWNNHVDLALWADLFLIAPSSANTLGKLANGICDNLLGAVYFSAKCPVVFAPAMDLDMYQHKAVKNNLAKLQSYGNFILEAEYGELASGLVGQGRMPEPESIVSWLKEYFSTSAALQGKKVLVTAGPTYESIDPVRFIGNYSSGKMGYELAFAAKEAGAEVVLISGPTHLPEPGNNIKFIKVKTAAEMHQASLKEFEGADFTILAAAVADYTPKVTSTSKIKKKETELTIELTKTVDIAASLGSKKKEGQVLVGFALETDNEMANATEKLQSKNFDFIVLNSLKDEGAGFGYDTNKVTIIGKDGSAKPFGLKSKKEVAKDILETLIKSTNGQ